MTPLKPVAGAADADRPTTDAAEEGVDAFTGPSRVTHTGSVVTKILVNEELVSIKIENIPSDYRLFNLVFIICS